MFPHQLQKLRTLPSRLQKLIFLNQLQKLTTLPSQVQKLTFPRQFQKTTLPHQIQNVSPPPKFQFKNFHTSAFSSASTTAERQFQFTTDHFRRPKASERIPLSHSEEIEQVLEDYQEVIQEFAQVLGCRDSAMAEMIRRDTRLVTRQDKELVKTKLRLLMDHGFDAGQILGRYQIVSRSLASLKVRLTAMDAIKHYKHSLNMLAWSDAHFQNVMAALRKEVATLGNHPTQTSFLAELLECSQDDVLALSDQNQCGFLLTMPPSRLKECVDILRSFGVSVSDIRQKCLMLKCPPDVTLDRLQRVSDAGVFDKRMVPYMLTNSHSHFSRSFAKWVRNAEALGGHANEQELLMDRLQCSKQQVQTLMKSCSSLAGIKASKLRRCLDVLQHEIGLPSHEILHHGNLLYLSPRRHLARWALLKSFDLSPSILAREMLLSERKFIDKYGFGSD